MPDIKKKPRSAKRFRYDCEAQVSMGNELDEARLTNISASGIQFETQQPLNLNTQVKLLWNDIDLGILGPNMIVVREVHKPERKQFSHIYGAQYHHLDSDLKNKLIQILKRLNQKEIQEELEKIQEASPDYLLKIASSGLIFLKKFLSGEEAKLPVLVKAIDSLADYEQRSFFQDNEVSRIIQHLSAQTFQSLILNSLVPIIAKRPDLKTLYLHTVASVIKTMKVTDKECETVLAHLTKMAGLGMEEDDGSRQCIEQSRNRAFYAKQDLLHSMHETFDVSAAREPEQKESLKAITSEFENTLEITKSSIFDMSVWDVIKKNKFTKILVDEVIIDNRPRPGATLIFRSVQVLIFFVLVLIFVLVMTKFLKG